MTFQFPSPSPEAARNSAILIDATRCWRAARDNGQPIQPSLSHALTTHDCAILAPVLDSLISFYEAALGRPIMTSQTMARSEDEDLLLALLDGSIRRQACIQCPNGAATALDCAICSTRIMLALVLTDPPRSGALQ